MRHAQLDWPVATCGILFQINPVDMYAASRSLALASLTASCNQNGAHEPCPIGVGELGGRLSWVHCQRSLARAFFDHQYALHLGCGGGGMHSAGGSTNDPPGRRRAAAKQQRVQCVQHAEACMQSAGAGERATAGRCGLKHGSDNHSGHSGRTAGTAGAPLD